MEGGARRVRHPRFGRGTILKTRHQGFEAFVHFDGEREPRWVRTDELSSEDRISPLPRPITQLPPEVDVDHHKARRMIEAFRLGIVPEDCVEDFTFGREKELDFLKNWLEDWENPLLYIFGEYGSGKTHLLYAISAIALKEGFAVALVELDPKEIPLYKPKRVFNGFIRNFKYLSPETGTREHFRNFLKAVFSKGELWDHKYFKYVLDYLDKREENLVWEWIECGEGPPRPNDTILDNILPPCYDSQNAANIYCYLLSGLGWASVKVLGLKGLLLLFDEAESIDMLSSARQIGNSLNFLKALKRVAENDESLLKVPYPALGLEYCALGMAAEIPFLYRIPSGLKMVFAFTHKPDNLPEASSLVLEHLPPECLKEISIAIHRLYVKAYQLDEGFPAIQLASGLQTNTRSLVKRCVEVLDFERLKDDV